MGAGRCIRRRSDRLASRRCSATVTAGIVAAVAVAAVISIVNGQRPPYGSIASLLLVVTIGNTLLGLIALQVVWLSWNGVWMIGAAAVGLWFVYRSYFRLRQRYGSLNSLHGFSHALAGVTETDDVAATALKMAKELLRAEHAQLVFRLPEGAVVKQLDEHGMLDDLGPSPGPRAPGRRPARIGKGLVLVPSEKQDDAQRALAERLGVADLVAAPFTADGFEGVFVVSGRLSDASTFDAEDAKVLETFAQNTGVALKVGELVDRLRREVAEREFQALHDSLTGLANRARLHEVVEEMIAAEPGGLVAVAVMDLDDFKDVNDALGHTTGDALLEEIGRRLTATVSAGGVVARLGGDEFAIASSGHADIAQVLRFVDGIRSTVEEPYVVDRLSLAVRFSVGVALSPRTRRGSQDAAAARRHRHVLREGGPLRGAAVRRRARYVEPPPARTRRRARPRPGAARVPALLPTAARSQDRTGRRRSKHSLAGPIPTTSRSRPTSSSRSSSSPDSSVRSPTGRSNLRCATSRLWREEWPDLRVSVNMSARNLMAPGFSNVVAGHLERAGLTGRRAARSSSPRAR